MIKKYNKFIQESVENKWIGPGNNDFFSRVPVKSTYNGSNRTMDFLRIGKHVSTDKIDGFIDSVQNNYIFIVDSKTNEIKKFTIKEFLKGMPKKKEKEMESPSIQGFKGVPAWLTKQKINEDILIGETYNSYVDFEKHLDIEEDEDEIEFDDSPVQDDDYDNIINYNDNKTLSNKLKYGTEDNPEGIISKIHNFEDEDEDDISDKFEFENVNNIYEQENEEDEEDEYLDEYDEYMKNKKRGNYRGTEDSPYPNKK